MNRGPFHHEIGDKIKFGPYTPEETVVARHLGSFGCVYAVRSDDPTVPVTALKTLRADIDLNEALLNQFANEAILWTQLPAHPCILPAFDVHRRDQRPYVRLAYVKPINQFGPSLGDWLKAIRGSHLLSAKAIASDASQLVHVLEFLEERVEGFCHDDIKPSNLLVDAANPQDVLLRLADFGLARAKRLGTRTSGFIAGDVRYLSPEVVGGNPPSKLSDVYAVGCTLLEMMRGVSYRMGADDEGKALSTNVRSSLRSRRPDIPARLVELALACVESEPENRPQSFRELNSELTRAIEPLGMTVGRRDVRWEAEPSWFGKLNEPMIDYLVHKRGLDKSRARAVMNMLFDSSSFLAVGEWRRSETLIDDLLKEIPGFASALARKAMVLLRSEQFGPAYLMYLEAARAFEDEEELKRIDVIQYGVTCVRVAQLVVLKTHVSDEEKRLAQDAAANGIEILPGEASSHHALGACQIRWGSLVDGIETLRRARELAPSDQGVRKTLAAAVCLVSGRSVGEISGEYQLTSQEENEVVTSVQALKQERGR